VESNVEKEDVEEVKNKKSHKSKDQENSLVGGDDLT
jgi:hypothetical protein